MSNLNNTEKTDWEEIKSWASGTDIRIGEDLSLVSSVPKSTKRKKHGLEKIFEEIKAEKFSNLVLAKSTEARSCEWTQ